ncbi:MAG: hypothetical protein CBC35_07420 [Planctomycetes bacterium TMED75]|nr:hypothetical protein [Planctomycetaceae bacterium]OUU92326.1 MAG: hypothetical protein CBC35_07420 [Planctomycetes bacterium TMED75]
MQLWGEPSTITPLNKLKSNLRMREKVRKKSLHGLNQGRLFLYLKVTRRRAPEQYQRSIIFAFSAELGLSQANKELAAYKTTV